MANWYEQLKATNEEFEFIVVAKNDSHYYYEDEDRDPNEVLSLSGSLEDVKPLMDYEFDSGYGGTNGPFFTAWTKDKVFFPVQYDGAEWIEYVPRNPCNIAKQHVGGG